MNHAKFQTHISLVFQPKSYMAELLSSIVKTLITSSHRHPLAQQKITLQFIPKSDTTIIDLNSVIKNSRKATNFT